MENLSAKQMRFCEEYVIDLNATQAAIRAGYSKNSAREQGSVHLTKPNMQKYISILQKEISERNKITVDECVQLLSKLARFDISEIFDGQGNLKDIHNIDKDALLSLEGVETEIKGEAIVKKVKISNRKQAIDMLMKHLGGYEKDNAQKKQETGQVMRVEVMDYSKKDADTTE